jgi:hypothetical protein
MDAAKAKASGKSDPSRKLLSASLNGHKKAAKWLMLLVPPRHASDAIIYIRDN